MTMQVPGNGIERAPSYGYTNEVNDIERQTKTARSSAPGGSPVPEAGDQGGATADRPPLSAPDSKALTLNNLHGALDATLSFGAMAMALIQESTSELVRDNREITYQAGMQSADLLEEQADKMREQATLQFVCGIIQGVMQIGSGIFQAYSAGKSLDNSLKALPSTPNQPNQPAQGGNAPAQSGSSGTTGSTETSQPAESKLDKKLRLAELKHQNAEIDRQNNIDSLRSQKIGGMASVVTGLGSLAQSIGKGMETRIEADIKDLEAQQKRVDTYREQIQSITESLQDTVRQAISTMSTISQNMVESNKRILG